MAIGDHLVRIRVRDYCYNFSSCEFNITVADLTAPQAVCKQDIVVGITNDGQAKVYPENIDNGSFDNCTPVRLEVYSCPKSMG